MACIVNNPIAGEVNCEYQRWAYRWQKMDDIIEGGPALKQRDLGVRSNAYSSTDTSTNGNTTNGMPRGEYLEVINPSDTTAYNQHRNQRYVRRANFVNYTQRTLTGLMGMVFRSQPEVEELSERAQQIADNIDGAGLSLDQQAMKTTEEVISNGRHGLLVDMPRKDDGSQITQADINNGMVPKIVAYDALDIIDWLEEVIDGKKKLVLVVLRETYVDSETGDPLKRETKCQDRVLRLVDGVYTQQVYKEGSDSNSPMMDERIPVIGADGRPLDFIPFVFVGSTNNTPDIDRIPLEAIGDVNLGQYKNSADIEESSHQISTGQLVISDDDFSRASRDPKQKNEVAMGIHAALILGSGGSAALLQPESNTLGQSLFNDKREIMAELGAQIIMPGGGVETAEAARIRKASEVSVLSVIVNNVSMAYTWCFNVALESFLGEQPLDGQYKLNDEFFETALTPDEARVIMESIQLNYLPPRILSERMQKAKIIAADEDLDALAEEAEESGAVNTPLDE